MGEMSTLRRVSEWRALDFLRVPSRRAIQGHLDHSMMQSAGRSDCHGENVERTSQAEPWVWVPKVPAPGVIAPAMTVDEFILLALNKKSGRLMTRIGVSNSESRTSYLSVSGNSSLSAPAAALAFAFTSLAVAMALSNSPASIAA